jgi:signal transduction histidine kinase
VSIADTQGAAGARRQTLPRMRLSIRGKIALAFLSICLVVAAVGWFAAWSVSRAGSLVVDTYDKPLMAISFARAIHADFATVETLFARRLADGDELRRTELDAQMTQAQTVLQEDLDVATKRATSERVRRSVKAVRKAVADWNVARSAMMASGSSQPDWSLLDANAAIVREEIDLLVNYAAGDGFKQRKETMLAIEENRMVQILGAGLAAAMAALVMFGLAYRIVSPVAEASRAATRIAEGELDVPIEISGRDELAALLHAMSIMRDKIRAMVELEISQRRSAQTRLVDAVESSSEGVILIDSDRNVLLSNAEIQAFCGIDNAPRPGDTLDAAAARVVEGGVFRADTPHQRAELLVQLRMADRLDMEAELTDGRWVRLKRSTASDGGMIFIVSDISLMKERESVLRDAAQRALAANRAKTEFLATMSHELRTPLNAVIGFADIMSSEVLGPIGNAQYKDFAGDILNSGRNLLAVINDILTLAKSEAGDLEMDREEVELDYLAERCADAVTEVFERANVSLETGPHEADCIAIGDDRRLRQVILALLSNAAKFTPAGGSVRLLVSRAPDGCVAISVSDTGIGMRPEDIPVALTAFGQIDGGRSRQYEGSGLGLTIANAIVDLHGGRLVIESAPGAGTTVKVVLPSAGEALPDMKLALAG